MAKPALSVVTADTPGPVKPARRLTITEAAASGDQLALLVAMRDRLARAVQDEDCPPRDLAALTRRLDDIAKQIKALTVEAEEEARERSGPSADEEWDASAI